MILYLKDYPENKYKFLLRKAGLIKQLSKTTFAPNESGW
jgi:hypothetical protein